MPSPNPRHVLLVLEATIGGTRRHVRELALGLVRDGWKVDLAYSAKRDPGFASDIALFKSAGIGLHEIPMERGFAPFSDTAAILRLRSLIKKTSPGILHMHSTKAGLVGRLASLLIPVARVYSPHCFAFNMQSKLAWLYKLTERVLVPYTDLLVAVCGAEALQAAEIGYKKGHIKVIYNGIEPSLTANVSKLKERNSIAFIGRDAPQKGLDILIDAFGILKKNVPEAKLTVMSDVTDKNKERLLALEAEILPFSQNEPARELLCRSEILAIPSRWEAFPYLVLEAFDAKTAIAASDVGGIAEATGDDAALLFQAGSTETLAEALKKLITDSQLRKKITDNGQEALNTFTFESMIKSVEEAYRNVVKQEKNKE